MALTPGTRLGPYEIVVPLGAGGMGEVYRAKDTRLDRTVAVKILSSHLADNAELKQRFEREARAISSLNHPHICGLYDVGSQHGVDFLVMEFLEGGTLDDRLRKGALPVEHVLRYGIQIADALDKAHKQGVVHRDLKPGNIMLTKSGVKLLDFGLAKLPQGPSSHDRNEVSALPTEARDITSEGTILGTIQYMAPEQLEGKNADSRTDIFAFGSVLYEMVTGKKAFTGKSKASLMSAILKDEPLPISQLQPMAPPILERIVKTCLAKDPDERWQNAHDLMGELKWISEPGSQATIAPPVRTRIGKTWLPWLLTVVALVVAAAALLRNQNRPAAFAGSIHSSIILAEKSSLRAAALSPDGSKFAFVARDSSGTNLLWIRALDSLTIQPLPGTENPSFPFWSPDGRYIGFFAGGKLKKIDASGGLIQTLCDAPFNRGGTWNQDGVILFTPAVNGPIYRISASGGQATPATTHDPVRGETTHRWPYFLPDGHHFLYLVASFSGEKERTGIYVRSLDSNEEKLLVRTNSNVAYAPPGYILYYRERNLVAQPFDAKTLQLTGDPFPVAEDIQYFPQIYGALFSASQNGELIYQPEAGSGNSQLQWFDRSGKMMGTLGTAGNQTNPRISPDGKRVALNIADPQTGNNDIWIYESTGGLPTRFTSDPSFEAGPIWSPDGAKIVFDSLQHGDSDLHQKNSDGSGNDQTIFESRRTKYAYDWSRDGQNILFMAFDAKSNLELWALPAGHKEPVLFMKSPFGVNQGQFSPDGRWVAYSSNESGKWEVHVAPFPGPGGNWQVSTNGGSEPRWRRDGKELFYMAPDGKIMAVDVSIETSFEAGLARPLFQTHRRETVSSADLYSYDVSADGQRFLVNTDVGESTPSMLMLILNWTASLKK